MTLISINIYLLNDDSIHVINKDLNNSEYKTLIKHLQVLNDLPVYINDEEFDINKNIDVLITNNSKIVKINDYEVEI